MNIGDHELSSGLLEQLLRTVVKIADTRASLGDRRRLLVEELANVIVADAGFWPGGRGGRAWIVCH